MLNCPVESLVEHVEDSIPAIRCMIFHALAEKKASKALLEKIVLKHKNDTALYVNSSTDAQINWTVKGYMGLVLEWRLDNKVPTPDYKSRLKDIRIRNENRIRVIIPSEYHSTVVKDSLLAIERLKFSVDGSNIISFSLTHDDTTIETSNVFTENVKDFIRMIAYGDKVVIDDILVEVPDKSIRRLNPIVLTIR